MARQANGLPYISDVSIERVEFPIVVYEHGVPLQIVHGVVSASCNIMKTMRRGCLCSEWKCILAELQEAEKRQRQELERIEKKRAAEVAKQADAKRIAAEHVQEQRLQAERRAQAAEERKRKADSQVDLCAMRI